MSDTSDAAVEALLKALTRSPMMYERDAAALLRALRDERNALHRDLKQVTEDAVEINHKLHVEIDALRADRERLDWLNDQRDGWTGWYVLPPTGNGADVGLDWSSNTLREAIDAAREET